jgi:tyrosinase
MSQPAQTTRRHFLKTSVAVAGASALPRHLALAQAPAKYRRYNVTSPEGQKALASYAKGVEAMLNLPPDHPHNWFRNAFVHLMDCPHGNWWFYVWHRGYLGYFEQTIRNLSKDPDFAMPYWDWTQLPQIPDSMFNGVLTPTDSAYEPFTKDIGTFTSYIQPTLKRYWDGLSPAQINQLNLRGYTSFEAMWNDVTGFTATPPPPHINLENMAFAQTPGARYLTRTNPKLSEQVTYNTSAFMVYSGLLPTDFYDPINQISFNSSKTTSHNTPPNGNTLFSTLEGFPHNSTHNYIGGYGPIPKGPWGNMTNNLSPVDPIFFLHHSNMDRLWDVWTRKQQALKLPYLPSKADFPTYAKEPFLFYVDGNGGQVGASYAKDYISTDRFQYDYQPGFGEAIIKPPSTLLTANHEKSTVKGSMKANAATLTLSGHALSTHLAADSQASLFALVTLPRPTDASPDRQFDVLVDAPSDVNQVGADSPYYAGTIAFFGGMMHMHGMSSDATFLVPLPKAKEAFKGLTAANGAEAKSVAVTIRVVPSEGGASVLKSATVRAL